MSNSLTSNDLSLSYEAYKRLCFNDNAKRTISRKFMDSNVELYPNIFSQTDENHFFLKTLSNELKRTLRQSDVDEDGIVVGSPILTDFQELKTEAGSVRPIPYSKMEDIETHTRLSSFDDSFLIVMRQLMKVKYRKLSKKYGRVSKLSNSGLPYFLNDSSYKLQHASLIANNIADVLNSIKRNELKSLYNKYRIVFGAIVQIRRQNDAWFKGKPKKRKYASFDQAYRGEEGAYYDDKELFRKELASCRTRQVAALSGPMNYVFTAMFEPFRHWAEHTYEFTYKHRTGDEVIAKLKTGRTFVGLDVSSFDRSIRYVYFRSWLYNLPIDDSLKKAIDLYARSPLISTENRKASGHPFESNTFNKWQGLPSGIFCTSAVGKDVMTSIVLTTISLMKGKKFEDEYIDSFLKGQASIKLLNQGDDSIIVFDDDAEKRDFLYIIKSLKEFRVDVEHGLKFLGNIYFRDNKDISWANDLSSYFRGVYIPERSINTLHRPYAMFGLRERRAIYSRHPSFLKARGIEVELFRQIFREDQNEVERRSLVVPKNFEGLVLSSSELEVIQSPEKLYYKYDKTDVRPEIYTLFSSDIPESVNDRIRVHYERIEFDD